MSLPGYDIWKLPAERDTLASVECRASVDGDVCGERWESGAHYNEAFGYELTGRETACPQCGNDDPALMEIEDASFDDGPDPDRQRDEMMDR